MRMLRYAMIKALILVNLYLFNIDYVHHIKCIYSKFDIETVITVSRYCD